MNLYVLRHGIAVERNEPGYEIDSERPLTEEGERKIASIARAMNRLELSFEIILSSPFVRARQTAEIVAVGLGLEKKLEFSENLASGGDSKKLIDEIVRSYGWLKSVMLVGHEPDLSRLISVLISGGKNCEMNLKKGGFCKLSVETLEYKQCASLNWFQTPKQLIAIAND